MPFKIAIVTLVFLTASASAVLPPFYHTAAQYKALLEDPTLIELLGSGQAIESISLTSSGFKVETPKYELLVDILYEPQDYPGPAKFHFHFYKPMEKY